LHPERQPGDSGKLHRCRRRGDWDRSELMPRKALLARQDQWIIELARRFLDAIRGARIHSE